MNDFKVVVVAKILKVEAHPNADRLELATVFGWNCVVQKGAFQAGDLVVYIPIDSVLPQELEDHIFGPQSKIKLHNHRVKTIKLRGAISQGLIVSVPSIMDYLKYDAKEDFDEDTELTEALKVIKYEPWEPDFQAQVGPARKTYKNPHFKTYYKMSNFKYYDRLFQPEDEVVITEKIHGTNFRAGWVPFYDNTLWRKILKFVGLAPKWQFVYGSHNVQISEKFLYNGYYDSNVYVEAVKKYELAKKIPKGRVIYGEIYGDGIQKNYVYGLDVGEHRFALFDIMDSVSGEYLNWAEFHKEAVEMKLEVVPILHVGPYGTDDHRDLIEGRSTLNGDTIREGAIIKSTVESPCAAGRKCLKAVNPEYLLGDNSDNH